MVREYSDMADRVMVLISRPTKSGRKLPNGREIMAEDSLKIWEVLVDDLPNVEVKISDHASPITAAYEYVGRDGPLKGNETVILGASSKDDDWKRWTGAEQYIKDGVKPSPEKTAVIPATKSDGTPFSATDMRALIGAAENDENAIEELEEYIGEDNVFDLLSIFGIGAPMNELSGGAAAGAVYVPKEKEKQKISIYTPLMR